MKEESERAGLKFSMKKTKIRASSPITYWQTNGEKVEAMTDFLFFGSKITADSDCSHEIRRCLLLGRKAMTNLESVLKSKDITLPTKVCIVKAMVFPFFIYGWESWTIKKVQHWRIDAFIYLFIYFWIDAFKLWSWRRLLRVSWTARSYQSILKEINPEYSLEGWMLKLKLQYFGHLCDWLIGKDPMLAKIEGRRRRGQQRMRCLDGITDSVDMNLGKLWEMVRGRESWHAVVHEVMKSGTWLCDWTTKKEASREHEISRR